MSRQKMILTEINISANEVLTMILEMCTICTKYQYQANTAKK